MEKQSGEWNVSIVSVEQAHDLLRRKEIDHSDLQRLCDTITTSDIIVGSSTDYHNLAVEFTKEWGCYLYGLNIVEKGLSLYPYDIDLLADAVYYGSCAGQFETCEKYADTLRSRPYALWSWRAFTFMIDYYIDRFNWLETETKIVQSLITALDLATQAQQILPTEERGYLAEYRVHELLERWHRGKVATPTDNPGDSPVEAKQESEFADKEHDDAIATLERAIGNPRIVAVQCCLRYADLNFEVRNYKKTIETCKKAFCYGESQPSAKMGYFLYLAALSMDALINEEEDFGNRERIEECYSMYRGACSALDDGRVVYLRNIELRIKNLELHSGIPFNRDR